MKKLLCMMTLVLLMMVLLTSCGATLVGTWNATIEGETGQMILREDGTGEIISHGLTRTCTWEADDTTITVEQIVGGRTYVFLDSATYVLEGDTLTVTNRDGESLVFEEN